MLVVTIFVALNQKK
ncbi:hypothetical protein [Paenibacillus harenae]